MTQFSVFGFLCQGDRAGFLPGFFPTLSLSGDSSVPLSEIWKIWKFWNFVIFDFRNFEIFWIVLDFFQNRFLKIFIFLKRKLSPLELRKPGLLFFMRSSSGIGDLIKVEFFS